MTNLGFIEIRVKMVCLVINIVLALWFCPPVSAASLPLNKVVILIIDNITLQDLSDDKLTHFRYLIDHGGLGLMNVRTKSLAGYNRESAYLTLGLGRKIHLPSGNIQFMSQREGNDISLIDGGFNLFKKALIFPDEKVQSVGIADLAGQRGFHIEYIGNTDTDKAQYYSLLMAANSQGVVTAAHIGNTLLEKDSGSAWGKRTNNKVLLAESIRSIKQGDIIFIDYGDTARVSEALIESKINPETARNMKASALSRADLFLGSLLKSISGQRFTLMVMSPIPSLEDKSNSTSGLTPIIMFKNGVPGGLLSSNTTRRAGLVTGIDVAPTIIEQVAGKPVKAVFTGEPMQNIPQKNNLQAVVEKQRQFILLKRFRYVIHGLYTVCLSLILAGVIWQQHKGRKLLSEGKLRFLAAGVTSIPAAGLLVFPSLGPKHLYTALFLNLLLVAGTGLVCSRNSGRAFTVMGWMSILTSSVLIIDQFTGGQMLLATPFGFNDIFSGGRYYGMNNDSMGILLGSCVFGLFYMVEKLGFGKPMGAFLIGLVFLLAAWSQNPEFGANFGGSIAAMTTGLLAVNFYIFGVPLKNSRVAGIVAGVVMIELVIAYCNSQSVIQTHAGKAINALINQGFGRTISEILVSKLGLFLLMCIIPPWNFLLIGQLIFCYLVGHPKKGLIIDTGNHQPIAAGFYTVIFFGSLTALFFNDTGVIAASLMLTYLTMPLSILFLEESILS